MFSLREVDHKSLPPRRNRQH